MLVPLHLKADDFSQAACQARVQLLVQMASINPNGFRKFSKKKRRKPYPNRRDTVAFLAAYAPDATPVTA